MEWGIFKNNEYKYSHQINKILSLKNLTIFEIYGIKAILGICFQRFVGINSIYKDVLQKKCGTIFSR